jgi:hypothetical protein
MREQKDLTIHNNITVLILKETNIIFTFRVFLVKGIGENVQIDLDAVFENSDVIWFFRLDIRK